MGASPFHRAAKAWIEQHLNGSRRVGLPWQTLAGFVRIATNARAIAEPLLPTEAWQLVDSWLDAPTAWVPHPTAGHREILGRLVTEHDLRGNLVADAVLAALCVEHGLSVVSADSDFARFPEVRWINPISV